MSQSIDCVCVCVKQQLPDLRGREGLRGEGLERGGRAHQRVQRRGVREKRQRERARQFPIKQTHLMLVCSCSYGISFIGDFTDHDPPQIQQDVYHGLAEVVTTTQPVSLAPHLVMGCPSAGAGVKVAIKKRETLQQPNAAQITTSITNCHQRRGRWRRLR